MAETNPSPSPSARSRPDRGAKKSSHRRTTNVSIGRKPMPPSARKFWGKVMIITLLGALIALAMVLIAACFIVVAFSGGNVGKNGNTVAPVVQSVPVEKDVHVKDVEPFASSSRSASGSSSSQEKKTDGTLEFRDRWDGGEIRLTLNINQQKTGKQGQSDEEQVRKDPIPPATPPAAATKPATAEDNRQSRSKMPDIGITRSHDVSCTQGNQYPVDWTKSAAQQTPKSGTVIATTPYGAPLTKVPELGSGWNDGWEQPKANPPQPQDLPSVQPVPQQTAPSSLPEPQAKKNEGILFEYSLENRDVVRYITCGLEDDDGNIVPVVMAALYLADYFVSRDKKKIPEHSMQILAVAQDRFIFHDAGYFVQFHEDVCKVLLRHHLRPDIRYQPHVFRNRLASSVPPNGWKQAEWDRVRQHFATPDYKVR